MNVSRRLRAPGWIADVVPATLATALALWEMGSGDGFRGATTPNVACVLIIGAGLLFRRSRPATSAAVVGASVAAQAVVVGTPESAGMFLGILLSVFSVSAHARGRRRWLGGLAALVSNVVALSLDPNIVAFDEALPGIAIALGAWAIGDLVGRRTDQATVAEAARRTAEERREEEAREAVAHERARIAREIHDVIAHGLGAIVVQAGAARIEAQDETTAERMQVIERTGRESLLELRRLLGVLRRVDEAPPLAPQPGVGGLDALADIARAAGVEVSLVVADVPEEIPPGVALCAYRIVQEGLTNVVKHAGASRCTVSVRRRNGSIVIEVVDDGHSATAPREAGYGLVGMGERVQIYGGALAAGPRDGGGFAVCATLPLHAGAR